MNSQCQGQRAGFVCGSRCEDTVEFDDVTHLQLTPYNSRIERVDLEYDTQIYGLEVTYSTGQGRVQIVNHVGKAPGPRHRSSLYLDVDEYIVHVSGSYGLAIECLKLVTNKGQTVEVGGHNGQSFEITIPQKHTVMGFKGGVGGLLYHLVLVMKPLAENQSLTSPQFGRSHTDTRLWDDLVLFPSASHIQFQAIRLISDGVHVLGLEVHYLINGRETLSSGLHLGTQSSGNPLEQTLTFQANELITQIDGRAGVLIDYLRIRTDKGQEIACGGKGGSVFRVPIPQDKQAIAFGGGVNGHLHCFYVHFA